MFKFLSGLFGSSATDAKSAADRDSSTSTTNVTKLLGIEEYFERPLQRYSFTGSRHLDSRNQFENRGVLILGLHGNADARIAYERGREYSLDTLPRWVELESFRIASDDFDKIDFGKHIPKGQIINHRPKLSRDALDDFRLGQTVTRQHALGVIASLGLRIFLRRSGGFPMRLCPVTPLASRTKKSML